MGALFLLSPAGEVVEPVDAQTLLEAAGLYDLDECLTANLAAFDERARELEAIAREARGLVGDQLLDRLDRGACWTLREGVYEIKAPSPTAGTTAYDTDELHDALALLVGDGVITQAAAAAALEPSVPKVALTYEVVRQIVRGLQGELDQPDLERVGTDLERLLTFEPEPTYTQRPAGIAALLKLPAARPAIEACQRTVEPPRRVARIKRVAK